jgi:hypothetical protein
MKSKINQIIKIAFITLIILTTLIMSFISVNGATDNKLNIKSISVYVNDKIVDEDDEIEVYDGDKVKISVTLENKYDDDDDISIEDAYFELDCDNDWDFADGEKSDEEDIKEDSTEIFEIEFTIDKDDIDDDDLKMKILAYGDDEEDSTFKHSDEETLEFTFDNPTDALKFKSFSLRNNPVNCNDKIVYLDMKILNYGTNEQENAEVRVYSKPMYLNYYSSKIFKLGDGDSLI